MALVADRRRVMLSFLVVDDEPWIAMYLARWLRMTFEEADVRVASDNTEALRILESFAPTLIVTDFHHPGGTGVELLAHLRAHPNTHRVPVVLLSASAVQPRPDHVLAGFDAVLSKPCGYDQFIGAVSRLLKLSIDPDTAILHIGEESPGLKYRGSVDLRSSSGRADLAKDVAAMARYGGGSIVIGVAEVHPGEFAPIGIPRTLGLELETARLNKVLGKYLDLGILIEVRRIREGSRHFAILRVPGMQSDSPLT